MKELPDEKTMQEILQEVREFEQLNREICEMSTAIAHDCQVRVSEFRFAASHRQVITEYDLCRVELRET